VSGQPTCPAGFVRDYAGYLMSNKFSTGSAQYSSEYICVDGTAGGVTSSGRDSPSAVLHPVELFGSLPSYVDSQSTSHAYANGKEITCAQCSTSVGPTYVRWGRSTCPAASTLVYAGHAAGGGSGTGNKGSGYNYMCLHGVPVYGEFTTAANNPSGRLYRVEYETARKGLYQAWKLQDHDVPCAVCQAAGSTAVLMQPGSTACPDGWSSEYFGYMMSAPQNTQRAEYICVDAEAEAAPSSSKCFSA
jgi:hypothetical protein